MYILMTLTVKQQHKKYTNEAKNYCCMSSLAFRKKKKNQSSW